MDIQTFEVGPFLENTYLLTKDDQHLIFDPGFSNEEEYQTVKNKITGTLKAVVLTHAHVDHVMGLSRLLLDFEVPVYLSDEDRYLWNNFGNQAQMFGLSQSGFTFQPEPLPSGEKFSIGNFTFTNIYTPGHAPDHLSFYFEEEEFLLAGDALFKQSIGRTDLHKGSFELLEKSIKEKLYTLPDATTVYPGHGPATTIGHEKQHNSFVKP